MEKFNLPKYALQTIIQVSINYYTKLNLLCFSERSSNSQQITQLCDILTS